MELSLPTTVLTLAQGPPFLVIRQGKEVSPATALAMVRVCASKRR